MSFLRWAVTAASICLANNALAAASSSYQPTVGQTHQDFVLPRIDDGKPLSLASLRGRPVVLIHFASW